MHNSRITECPHCNTAFRVTEAQMRAAKGAVRCGSCLEIFLAHQHWLSDDDSTAELELDDWGDDASAMFAELEQLDHDLENSIDDESWALKLLEEEAAETAIAPPEKPSANDDLRISSNEPLFVVIDDEQEPTDADNITDHDISIEKPDDTEADSAEKIRATIHESVAIDATATDNNDAILFSTAPLITSLANQDDDRLETEKNQREPTLSNYDLHDSPVLAQSASQSDSQNDPLYASPDDLEKLTENPALFETEFDRLDAIERQTNYNAIRQIQNNRRSIFPDWLAVLLIIASTAGLGGQYLLHNLNTLSQNPQWRSTTETFCAITGCTVPEWRDLQAIQHDNLVVRSHPQQTDALLINVRLINSSAFAQTFPLLELRFSDINGNEIASRRFKPEEYLAGELSGLKKMPVNQAIQIELALVDPGKAAVNYQMQLLENY